MITQLVKLAGACALMLLSQVSAQTPDAVLSLPEMWVTSIRGSVTDRYNATDPKNDLKTRMQTGSGPQGSSSSAALVKPGTRLYVNNDSHALISFPGAGHAMIVGNLTSIYLPRAGERPVTIGFDEHPASPAKGFFNISAAEMAKHPGKEFSLSTKKQSNSANDKALSILYAQTVISTTGARFFVVDCVSTGVGAGVSEKHGNGCLVGVFEGSVTVKETVGKKVFVVQPGMVVAMKPYEISPPRAMTKAELSYDIGCKFAALGKEVPAKLPSAMKTTPKSLPGMKVNSLGMTFVPLPKTSVLMCVHETRGGDYAAFLAAEPASPAAMGYRYENGYWGWDDYPVRVSWDYARAFCEWLSRKEGKKYRLPTDEEWSEAAGIAAKENHKPGIFPEDLSRKAVGGYPWGSDWPPKGAGNFGDISREAEFAPSGRASDWEAADPALLAVDDGYAGAAPVMSFEPNKFGIYDLAGNLEEWCEDWYDAARTARVLRGSGFTSDRKSELLASYRMRRVTSQPAGFRVVMESR